MKTISDRQDEGRAGAILRTHVLLPEAGQDHGVAGVGSFGLRNQAQVQDVAGDGSQAADAEGGPGAIRKLCSVKLHSRDKRHTSGLNKFRATDVQKAEYTRGNRQSRGRVLHSADPARFGVGASCVSGAQRCVEPGPGDKTGIIANESARSPSPSGRRALNRRTGLCVELRIAEGSGKDNGPFEGSR